MEIKNNGEAFVFVGLGGTFWAANPYLQQILVKRAPATVLMIDPDQAQDKNRERQWCVSAVGRKESYTAIDKVSLSTSLFTVAKGYSIDGHTTKFYPELLDKVAEINLVMIVNVDNDQARLQCLQACQGWEEGRAICVVTGCVEDFGQVYYGVWDDGIPLHNFLPLHPDIGDGKDGGTGETCGEQTIFSNAMTGVLLGKCLDHIFSYHVEGRKWDEFKEYYWGVQDQGTWMKESTVDPVTAITDFESITAEVTADVE